MGNPGVLATGRRRLAIIEGLRSAFGTTAALRIVRTLAGRHGVARLELPGWSRPVLLRRKSADFGVFQQVFVDRDYELDLPAPPAWILDCGAHIGMASLWLARRYPGVPIIAVEPEPSNVELLRRNLALVPGAVVVEGAVWAGSEDEVRIADDAAETWAFQVSASGSGPAVPVCRMADLVELAHRTAGAGRGLVKLDIEGAEREVLGQDTEWLDDVRYLVIELHDRMVPGCEQALDAALAGRACERETRGENVVVDLLP